MTPRLTTAVRHLAFATLLLAAASVREGPASVVDQAIIWLPTGIAIAGVWILGLRAAASVAIVTLIQRWMLGYDMGVAVPAAIGSTAEALAGVLVLRQLDFRAELSRLRDVFALMAAAAVAPLASIFFSWIGRSFFWSNPTMPFYSGWDGWWRMNALGALTIVPLAVSWLRTTRREITARSVGTTALALVGVPAVTIAVMWLAPADTTGVLGVNLVLALVVLFAAVRFGVRGATLASALAVLTVALTTTHGLGPFLAVPRPVRHVAIQLFEFTAVALPPAFGALIAERRAALERGVRSDVLRLSIQSALPDVVYRVALDGTCLDVSVPAALSRSFRREELVGRPMTALFPPGQGDSFLRAIRDALAVGTPATIEYETKVDGQRRVHEARCVPHGDDEILAVVRDITQRKWSEGMMAFEARILADVATGRPSAEVCREIVAGIERLVPDGLCSILVLNGDRLHVGSAPSLPAAYNEAVEGFEIGAGRASCGTAAATGQLVVVEDIAHDPLWTDWRDLALVHGLRACWSLPVRDAVGAVIGTFAVYYREARAPGAHELALAERAAALAGIALDRERRSEALRRSEELLASINSNVQEGLFRATASLEVRYANDALARMFGHGSPEAFVGADLVATVEDRERVAELLGRLERDGRWVNEEVRFLRADGTAFWGLVSATLVRETGGQPPHVDGAIADVTARKELEEQFRQSQKMEAVGKLAGGVAHDFNNLLTVIFGYADAIRGDSAEGDPVHEHAEQVLEAARRASGLTRQLLAYSRQQVLSPQVLELAAVVGQMGDMLQRLIGEDVRLLIEPPRERCWVRVDRSQIEQVLLNLVVNARDAMRTGGTLTIATVHADRGSDRVAPGEAASAEPSVLLRVSDTGVGMTPEVQARAFDPFFTTKGLGEGTGLGLSTVYGIVKQSGGSVWLESAPGAGTTVWIRLPRWAAPDESAATPAPVAAISGAATVLLAEDDPGVRELVSHTLEHAGYRVLAAGDGAEALAAAGAHPGSIDVVVSDVVMPHLGGRELAARLLDARPQVRVLFISGYADDAREREALCGPNSRFLAKPFAPEALVERVRDLLRPEGSAA